MGFDQSILRQNTRKLITITEVNTQQGTIFGVDSLYNDYTISWLVHGAVVIAPQVGETWIITRHDDTWELYKRHEIKDPLVDLRYLQPGDRRLEASHILYLSGTSVVLRGNATIDKDLEVGEGLALGILESSNINVQGDVDQLVLQGFTNPQKKFVLSFNDDKDYATINAWQDPNISNEDHAGLLSTLDLLVKKMVLAENGGFIGIGKIPSYTLDIEGDVNITGDYLINGVPIDTGGGGEDLATQAELDAHIADTTSIHGIADTSVLATDSDVTSAISTHEADTTNVHGITNTANLLESGDAAGGVLAGTYPNPTFASDMATQAELDAHINDATDAHDATAISYAGGTGISATNVETAIDELATEKADIAQESWTNVTYNTGWADYNVAFFSLGYYKDTLGVVHLRGLAARGSGTETTIFTLPLGYRPSLDMMFSQAYFDGTATFSNIQIRINDTGTVVMHSPTTIGTSGYISLDGITFRV